MSSPTLAPVVARSLAHPSIDPPTLVARVQEALGWEGSDFLVGLRGYDALVSTMESALDLDGLFRTGDPASPHVKLLRSLNSSATGLRVTRVADVASPWRWVRVGGAGADGITGVALRQQSYLDVVGALGRAGVTFRVVPDETRTEELLATAAPLGSAVLDAGEVAAAGAGATGSAVGAEVPGYLDDQHVVTYGLVSREAPAAVDVVWLSMSGRHEQAGTLMVALEQFSRLGLDLEFLHSDPQGPRSHDFFAGFAADQARAVELQEALSAVGFSSRVLASFARPAATP